MAKSGGTKKAKLVFGLGDIHWRLRDETAVAVAEAAHRMLKPDITVFGGDVIDCEPFSRWPSVKVEKEGLGHDWVDEELEPAAQFVERLAKRTKELTVFLEGNHEAHVERFCSGISRPGAAIHELISPRRHFSFLPTGRGSVRRTPRPNFLYVPYHVPSRGCNIASGSSYQLSPKLSVVHGWTACKHAAAKHLELSKTRSLIYHHTHRRQMEERRDPWTGEPLVAFSAGCLCKLQPIFKHHGSPSDWSHGFWLAYLGSSGGFTAYPIAIRKGKAILPDGREVKP